MVTEADIRKALKETVDSDAPQEWARDFDFRGAGVLDSLDHVTFLLHLQERHGFKFKDQDVAQLNTIQAVLDYARTQSI